MLTTNPTCFTSAAAITSRASRTHYFAAVAAAIFLTLMPETGGNGNAEKLGVEGNKP